MTALARTSSNCKGQNRPLVKEGAPHQQPRKCLAAINIWSRGPDGGVTSRQTGRLTQLVLSIGPNYICRRRQNSVSETFYIKQADAYVHACYHSVQNLLSSRLLSKNIKVGIYKTIILPVVLYGCETWSLTLREERRLRVYEKRVLRIFGLKGHEMAGG
jgi:hypothetical protein